MQPVTLSQFGSSGSRSDSLIQARFANGERVIPSLLELAEFVFQEVTTEARDAAGLSPQLSEILGAKRRPKQFREPILKYVEWSAAKRCPDDLGAVLALFRERLEEEVGTLFKCEPPDVTAFTRAVLIDGEFIAVLPQTVFEDRAGRTLLKVALERMRLLSSQGSHTRPLKLTVCFKGTVEALRWWLDLYTFVRTLEPGRSNQETARTLVDACNDGVIAVYAIPAVACLSKVMISKPTSPDQAQGFTLNSNRRTGIASFSLLPASETADWLQEIYVPFIENASPLCAKVHANVAFHSLCSLD